MGAGSEEQGRTSKKNKMQALETTMVLSGFK